MLRGIDVDQFCDSVFGKACDIERLLNQRIAYECDSLFSDDPRVCVEAEKVIYKILEWIPAPDEVVVRRAVEAGQNTSSSPKERLARIRQVVCPEALRAGRPRE